MRIIIPGASGFIGKNLLLKLPPRWEVIALYNTSHDFLDFLVRNNLQNVYPLKVDLSDKDQIKKIVSIFGDNFDFAVYLAANGDPIHSVKDPSNDLLSNTITLINFLESIHVDRFLYFSSGAVYDGLIGEISPASALFPILPYAISNLASESYIKFYHLKRKKINSYIILRFFGAFGPYEPERKIYTKLIKNFALEKKESFSIAGDGNNLIDAMYIDDTIDGILKVIESNYSNITLDFAFCNPITINELVKTTARIFGIKNPDIKHENTVPEYIAFKADCRTFNKTFDFETKINLDEGILKFCDFLVRTKNK